MDRLLQADLPAGGKCDTKTLAAEAGVTCSALGTYVHLKAEFEQRRSRAYEAGATPDRRDGQITRLKAENAALRQSLTRHNSEISGGLAARGAASRDRAAAVRARQQRQRVSATCLGAPRLLGRAADTLSEFPDTGHVRGAGRGQ